jgi:glutathione S-transferase
VVIYSDADASTPILQYLDEAYPDTKNLFPTDPTQKALVRIQLDYVSKKVFPAVFKLIQAQESSAQADAKKELIESYKELTEKVKGPFFAGEEFGAVDLALAPWFARCALLLLRLSQRCGPDRITCFTVPDPIQVLHP